MHSIDFLVFTVTGSIPTEIGALTALTRIDLCCNELTGSIPTGIVDMRQMSRIDLFKNQLEGNLPAGMDAMTKLLTWLRVEENLLTGTIPQLKPAGQTFSSFCYVYDNLFANTDNAVAAGCTV